MTSCCEVLKIQFVPYFILVCTEHITAGNTVWLLHYKQRNGSCTFVQQNAFHCKLLFIVNKLLVVHVTYSSASLSWESRGTLLSSAQPAYIYVAQSRDNEARESRGTLLDSV